LADAGVGAVKINLNDPVIVKLEKAGLTQMQRHFDQYGACAVPHPSPDEVGRYRFQLWELFVIFGDSVRLGLPVPFEQNSFEIRIRPE
jgi:hypothetical protein